MNDEKQSVNPSDPVNQQKRLYWLIQTFDKSLDRFDSSFTSLNQKATWTLAIATGFAATSGFTKSASLITLFENGASNTDLKIVPVFILFGLAYLALLFQVWNVYRPQDVGFPISPLITSDLAPPVSQREDQGTYVQKCLADVQHSYINLEEMEFLEKALLEYINANVEAFLLNQRIGKYVDRAFKLLISLAILFMIMLFLPYFT